MTVGLAGASFRTWENSFSASVARYNSRPHFTGCSLWEAPMRRVVVRMGEYIWRPLTDSDPDTEFVVALRNAERFQPWFYNQRVTPETHRRFINAADERGEVNWLVEHAEGSGGSKPVGLASIYNFDKPNRKAECG